MNEASALADHIFERGLPIYGLTTGWARRSALRCGATTTRSAGGRSPRAMWGRGRSASRRRARGDARPGQPVRRRFDLRAPRPRGESGRRAQRRSRLPRVKSLGSLGASDLAPMADIARGALADVALAPGEGLALINSSAYGTATLRSPWPTPSACLMRPTSPRAFALEGFAANLSPLDPAVARARPDPMLSVRLSAFTICWRAVTSGRRARPATCRTR